MSGMADQRYASVDFTVEDGKEFVGSDCRLNGELAVISGPRREFAMVTQYHTRLGCEFAWPTVARIMTVGNKEFRS